MVIAGYAGEYITAACRGISGQFNGIDFLLERYRVIEGLLLRSQANSSNLMSQDRLDHRLDPYFLNYI